MREKYFFFGFGQVAKYYIDHLIKKKKKFSFNATSTSKTSLKFFREKNIHPLSLKIMSLIRIYIMKYFVQII